MIPELGNYALMLALGLALVQGVLPIVGSFREQPRWMALARPAACGQAGLVLLAFGCLVAAFVGNDFSVSYVANNSNSALPVYYRVAGTWGGHEGSLLLWIAMFALWTLAVTVFSRQLPPVMVARVLGVLGLVSAGFLCFILFTSDPFERLLPAAADGRDLNPLLQDVGMIAHPPLLYMGYVGFSVAFAFALAALMGGELDAAWARWSRPWTLVAWMFLTLGIFLGSFWAYYELGWGGWWFWDAVENASFMPWLVGTALLHSLAVTEKRGSFKNWTVLLAILAFSLSLLGTFLVRSGVLTSVHAFATDPRRGLFILLFLAAVVGGSLSLYAWRAPKVSGGGGFSLFSREVLLLVNNVLLLVAAGTVFLGTLYPLFLDALGLGKISVGPPYFEAVFVPLMAPMLFLLGAGPFVAWKSAAPGQVARKLRWCAAAALAGAALLGLRAGLSPWGLAGLALGLWILCATALHAWQRGRSRQPRSFWGMVAAHAGVGVFVIGVTLVKSLDVASDVRMQVGDTAHAGAYTFRLLDIKTLRGPNYTSDAATFEVTRDGRTVATMTPEKRLYTVQQMPMTEAAIDRSLTRDLYVSLGEPIDANTWVVRVQVKPFMAWIWSGCLLIAFGGLLAASDKRYRDARRRKAGVALAASAEIAAM